MMDFVVAIVAAFLGGAVVKRLGQPPVLGYLLAGIVVGPFATGLISDIARINTLAQIGVAFLMFQAGTELSLSQLRKMQGITLAGPFVQLLLMAPFVVVAVFLTQLPIVEVSYLGIILALSSTTVVIKLMAGRGEVDALHGRLAIAFSIVQDLPMIPAIVIFTSFALAANTLTSGALTLSVLGGLGKALAFVAVAYFVGAKLFPPFLKRIASYGGDLFLLCVVAVALGMAFLSSLLGISLVLGAFIAGLVVAESEVTYRVSREVSPISDIFVTFFFVSVGMLLDISFVLGHLSAVMVIVLVVVFGKAVLLTAIGLMFRYSARTSLLMGLTLAQIGEEAFLLAQIGLQHGILTSSSYSLVLAGAVISIVLNPLLLTSSPFLLGVFQKIPALKRAFLTSTQDPSGAIPEGLQGHTIVCGYG
ncbi:MAG: cation:proton antiporter, partial [Chloroflexi bacterium]|nr:cation:proton antiporter [Chloroflexota bacterium]